MLVELDYWLPKNATVDVWLAFFEDMANPLGPARWRKLAARLRRGAWPGDGRYTIAMAFSGMEPLVLP
ncbi:MAG TPA: hypothetical protein VKZ85_08805 [Woeseiaceae bacterium]|nr:hypothetical protein [Woeseiaceae bacterium]